MKNSDSQNTAKESLADYLQNILRHTVLLNRKDKSKEPPLGTSKIGGNPHLPADFQWPYYEGKDWSDEITNRPLAFLAQIDLKAVAPFDQDEMLPKSGYLYFFYETVSQPWGFDPADKGCAKVYYFDLPAEQLCITPFPDGLEEDARIPLSVLSYQTVEELPGYEEFCELTDTDRFGDAFDWDIYEEERANTVEFSDNSADEICKLLGYADLVQGAMLGECAQVAAGLYCGNGDAYENATEAQKAAMAEDAKQWILLAQFGTLSEESMFGDCGCIYFYIRKEDLAARRFDHIWLCLQCG